MPEGTVLPRTCVACDKDISDRHGNAKRCQGCADQGLAPATEPVCPTEVPCSNEPCPRAHRQCGWCGAHIGHMQKRAVYCTRQHKKNDGSRRHRGRNPGYYKRYHGSPARIAWRDANGAQIRSAARIRRQALQNDPVEREKKRQWWKRNPIRQRLYQENRRARKLNNPGSVGVTLRDWRRMVLAYRNCCAYCDVWVEHPHMDHVIPLSRGGRHAIGNVVPACSSCNFSKNARLLADWRYRR